MSLTICAISDTHGKHRELDLSKYPADVLIHAGDFTKGKDLGLSETQDFLAWFSEQPYANLLFIAGNHELQLEQNPEQLQELLLMYPNVIYLHHKTITINNVEFYGSNYSNEFCNWAFMEDELELSKIWDNIPDTTNVLITHGPAYGCHDLINRFYNRDPHVGSQSLTKRKQELVGTLKCHISGHIHEAYNISTANNLTNVCASVLDEHYTLKNKPILLEL